MFLHAIMLAGLGAAVMPIVLHLLSRARFRNVEWGAMMFLESATARLRNRSRLAQWLLLALRVLAIALLALALARPVIRRAAGPVGGHGLVVVVVIDGSPSMLHPEQNTTRFELARKAALGILADLHAGEEAALVELGAPTYTDTPPTTDLQRIASRLASLEPAYGSADLAEGVRRAEALLVNRADVPREVYLIADRQRSTWESLSSRRHDIPEKIIAVPIGSTENHNVAVEGVELLDPPAVAGLPMRVRVRVRNWADTPRGDLPLTIVAGKAVERTTLNLGANATEDLTRSIAISQPGASLLTATIGPAGMPGDDTAQLAVNVSDPLRVLTVNGEPPTVLQRVPSPAFTGTCDYFGLALDPYNATERKKPSPFLLRFASASPWPKPDRVDRVVVLADAVPPSDDAARALEQFVFSGGGVLLAPGANVSAEDWNRRLWSDGQGLAPAPMDAVQNGPATSLLGVQSGSPVFAFFTGNSSAVPAIDIARWSRFGSRFAPGSDVLASLKSGDPFLLERKFGRGRVIAMAGPLDASWSNLPLTRLYLPLMQSIVRRLASSNDSELNLSVGSPIELTVAAPGNAAVEIVRPDGHVDRSTLSVAGGVGSLVYTATNVPGRYTVRVNGQPDRIFAVRPPAGESNLSLQDDAALLKRTSSAGIDFVSASSPLRVGNSRKASEWSVPLILLTIAALAVESMLTSRLSAPAGEA